MKIVSVTAFAALGLCSISESSSAGEAAWSVRLLAPDAQGNSYAFATDGTRAYGSLNQNFQQTRATAWDLATGASQDLHPPLTSGSQVHAVSGTQRVGVTYGSLNRAVIWNGPGSSTVSLNPAFRSSMAYATNGTQQVGFVVGSGFRQATLWSGTAASIVYLEPEIQGTWSEARAISGSWQGGFMETAGGRREAMMWNGAPNTRKEMHPTGASMSAILAMDASHQYGLVAFPGTNVAARWSGTAASWISFNPAGFAFSSFTAVAAGAQVGYGGLHSQDLRALLWRDSAESWLDLHQFLPSHLTTSVAEGVWTDGITTIVTGNAYNSLLMRDEAVVWSIPSPASCGLVLCAGLQSIRRRRWS